LVTKCSGFFSFLLVYINCTNGFIVVFPYIHIM
jgi:hypothetical protein